MARCPITPLEEYRPLARRLATFAVTCKSCGWPENIYVDIAQAALLVEMFADAMEDADHG